LKRDILKDLLSESKTLEISAPRKDKSLFN